MDLHQLKELFKNKKLRLTQPRVLIFNLLKEQSKAMSAKEIHENLILKDRSVTDIASIYRNLSLFSELGLIHKLQDGKYSFCYHNIRGGVIEKKRASKHIHVLMNCTHCGRYDELKTHTEEVCTSVIKLKSHTFFLNRVHSLVLQGVCKRCLDL